MTARRARARALRRSPAPPAEADAISLSTLRARAGRSLPGVPHSTPRASTPRASTWGDACQHTACQHAAGVPAHRVLARIEVCQHASPRPGGGEVCQHGRCVLHAACWHTFSVRARPLARRRRLRCASTLSCAGTPCASTRGQCASTPSVCQHALPCASTLTTGSRCPPRFCGAARLALQARLASS